MFGTVYILRCVTSGKSYVGQTTLDLSDRLREHMTITVRKSYALSAAIRKYGRDAFTIAGVEACATRDALDAAEVMWIEKEGTRSPRGYNLTAGGRAFKHHAETRAKMSAVAKARAASNPTWGRRISAAKLASGFRHTAASRSKMSAAKAGRAPHNKGRPMSDAQRAKLRAAWVVRRARTAALAGGAS